LARHPDRPAPELRPELCKGCGRCLAACAHGCLEAGGAVHPESGLVPVVLRPEACTGCALCVEACPEPYALALPAPRPGPPAPPHAAELPDVRLELAPSRPLLLKGTHASAVGALLAGCRHFFGYPITPSTEGAERMAELLPVLGGGFVQAASEVAAVNMLYGCGAAGRRAMTFTSSPGFSLMLEGISYLVGAEVPAVFVDVMRAGPGLGNIGPAQADVALACRGLGHGDSHAIVLAPATTQELLDFTLLAFDLAFRYRGPVVLLADGHLGQLSGRVELPRALVRPGLPAWAVWGDAAHRRGLVTSIHLSEADLEAHVLGLVGKYRRMAAAEQRAETFRCEDAELLLIACGTPARTARGAVERLRAGGIRAGLFRPQTLWPFPVDALLPLLARARRLLVVEASDGQLEDEVRLALSRADAPRIALGGVRRLGGVLPSEGEILEAAGARAGKAVAA